MKLIKASKYGRLSLCDLQEIKVGELFVKNDRIYVKTSDKNPFNMRSNCVELGNGKGGLVEFSIFDDVTPITKISIELKSFKGGK